MGKPIKINLNGKIYTINLNDSITAEEFALSAPFDTSLIVERNHCYGPIPNRLFIDKSKLIDNPHKGGVYYADCVQSVWIDYGDGSYIKPFQIVYIGEILEDMSDLLDVNHRMKLKVDKLEKNIKKNFKIKTQLKQ